jgi:hypothetical protein
LDIAGHIQTGIERFHQFSDFALVLAFLVLQKSYAEIGPSFVELLSDAPGDRAIVGNARNKSIFSGQIYHLYFF